MTSFARLLPVSVALALASGCFGNDHCDHDQTYAHGLCFEPVVDAAVATADADFRHFGDTCVDPGACTASTPFCFVPFGTQTGYCTSTGCAVDADCPTATHCTDLSVFLPGEPSVCVK